MSGSNRPNLRPLLDDVKRQLDWGDGNEPLVKGTIDAYVRAYGPERVTQARDDLVVHIERWRSYNDAVVHSDEFEHQALEALDYLYLEYA